MSAIPTPSMLSSAPSAKQFKRLDILINNAGIAHPNLPIEKLPFPVWKDVLETNLDGMFLVTQAALAMMKRGGTIVNNLSIAATRVFPGSAAYNASKHGALGLDQYSSRRTSPARHPRDRAAPRRHRHRYLDHALAAGSPPQNDVRQRPLRKPSSKPFCSPPTPRSKPWKSSPRPARLVSSLGSPVAHLTTVRTPSFRSCDLQCSPPPICGGNHNDEASVRSRRLLPPPSWRFRCALRTP